MNFNEKIKKIQRSKHSLLCIGLDADPQKLPKHLRTKENGVLEFNREIIEATKDLVCAYKINFAFYEAMGTAGWGILEKTRAMIPPTILSIADAKRGDIGNSSLYYATGILKTLNFDSITVSPYLGKDSVLPFFQWEDKGGFLLALTSNEGANDFQYKKRGTLRLFEEVVRVSRKWSHNKNLGFVVGATRSRDLKSVRRLVPDSPLLIPGVGAQGGSLQSAIRNGCDNKGEMAIINASRSIIYASPEKNFAEAARTEALRLRDEMNRNREEIFHL